MRIVLLDVTSPAAMAEVEAIGKGRRLYISKADIMKHGLTEGCRTRLEAEIASEVFRVFKGENLMQVRRRQQQFQSHRDRMGFRTSLWMPEKRRENVVQKMLVMKQMTQFVEVHSAIQDLCLSAEYAARTKGFFCPYRGPPPPQKLESLFRYFFAALIFAVIGNVVGHVSVHTECHLISCYAALYRASGEPTLVIDVCQSASRIRRNYGDAAAHHSTHNTQDHTRTYQHQRQAHQHSNASQNNTRTSRSMEGGDGVVRARVEDASLAGSAGHGFRAAGDSLA